MAIRRRLRRLNLELLLTFGICLTISVYLFCIIPRFHILEQQQQQQQQQQNIYNNKMIQLSSPVENFFFSHSSSPSRQDDIDKQKKMMITTTTTNNKNIDDDAYGIALLKLRCFSTPGCFPSVKCRHGSPKKIKRHKRFEEQSFCADDLHYQKQQQQQQQQQKKKKKKKQQQNENNERNNCLVYSFGIFNSWEWEKKVATIFHCDVHAFDPTITLPTNLAPGVTFHKLGLQGADTDMSVTHGENYRPINKSLLLSLDEIKTKLGHVNRTIDVLMLDCEGCEWGVLRQLVCSDDDNNNQETSNNSTPTTNRSTHMVKQIMAEFHFQKNLGMQDTNDVMIAADAVSCLQKDRWAVTSIEQSGAGYSDLEYIQGVSTILHSKAFLMFMSLRRIPLEEKLPHELLEEVANAARKEEVKKVEYEKKYGFDNSEKWPDDYTELYNIRMKAGNSVRKVLPNRNIFDEYDTYVDEPEID